MGSCARKGVLPMTPYLLEVLLRALILVAVIPIHECAHGLAAS